LNYSTKNESNKVAALYLVNSESEHCVGFERNEANQIVLICQSCGSCTTCHNRFCRLVCVQFVEDAMLCLWNIWRRCRHCPLDQLLDLAYCNHSRAQMETNLGTNCIFPAGGNTSSVIHPLITQRKIQQQFRPVP